MIEWFVHVYHLHMIESYTPSVTIYNSFDFYNPNFNHSSYSKNCEKTKKSLWFCLLSNIFHFLYFLVRRVVKVDVEKVK
jgi:hypothetical protein